MSTIKTDNLTWRAGEAAANSQYTVTADKVIWGTAKSWINFNGGSGVSIRASFNFSSVTRNSQGNYTYSLTNALADANYCLTNTVSPDQAGTGVGTGLATFGVHVNWVGAALVTPTSSSARVSGNWNTSGYPDPTYICSIIVR